MGGRRTVGNSREGIDTLGSACAAANSHADGVLLGPRAPRRQPRQPRSVATVDAILEASTRVFESRGYLRATTNEVAELAGVSVGSLYQYFPDKAALLTALHERHIETVASAMLEAMCAQSATDRRSGSTLAAVVHSCVRLHGKNRQLQRLLHEQLPQLAYPRSESDATTRLARAVTVWLQTVNTTLADDRAMLVSSTLLTMGESLVHAAVLSPPAGVAQASLEEDITRALQGYLHAQGVVYTT